MKYERISSFYWDTGLSKERREAIVAWVKSLPADKKEMITEMIHDTELETHFNSSEDA